MREAMSGKVLFFILMLAFGSLLVIQPAQAVWHVLLNERFSDEAPDWPWGDWTILPEKEWGGG